MISNNGLSKSFLSDVLLDIYRGFLFFIAAISMNKTLISANNSSDNLLKSVINNLNYTPKGVINYKNNLKNRADNDTIDSNDKWRFRYEKDSFE